MPQGARNNISDKLDRQQTTATLSKCSALGRCFYFCCHAISSKVENKIMFFVTWISLEYILGSGQACRRSFFSVHRENA